MFRHFITKFHMFCVPLYCIWVGLSTKEEALFPLGNCAMLRKRERVRAREGGREGGREREREGGGERIGQITDLDKWFHLCNDNTPSPPKKKKKKKK